MAMRYWTYVYHPASREEGGSVSLPSLGLTNRYYAGHLNLRNRGTAEHRRRLVSSRNHTVGGFYHDGRFEDLKAVVAHYNRVLNLALTSAETSDLIEYLKSL
jgi:cytochrome c peroxidase